MNCGCGCGEDSAIEYTNPIPLTETSFSRSTFDSDYDNPIGNTAFVVRPKPLPRPAPLVPSNPCNCQSGTPCSANSNCNCNQNNNYNNNYNGNNVYRVRNPMPQCQQQQIQRQQMQQQLLMQQLQKKQERILSNPIIEPLQGLQLEDYEDDSCRDVDLTRKRLRRKLNRLNCARMKKTFLNALLSK